MLNANYLLARVKDVPAGAAGDRCMHEFVASAAELKAERGIAAMDIAKRLLDYGFHAPTVYFPLIVREAVMIEPTETESKATLDAFAEALRRALHATSRAEPAARGRAARARRSAGPTRSVLARQPVLSRGKVLSHAAIALAVGRPAASAPCDSAGRRAAGTWPWMKCCWKLRPGRRNAPGGSTVGGADLLARLLPALRGPRQHPASRGCPAVRRLTGGGAIVHDAELTYSLAMPAAASLGRRPRSRSTKPSTSLIEALAELGIAAQLLSAKRQAPAKREMPARGDPGFVFPTPRPGRRACGLGEDRRQCPAPPPRGRAATRKRALGTKPICP